MGLILRSLLRRRHSREGGCATMSLRGSERTEAISEVVEIQEIAALPRIKSGVARNDRKGL